MTKQELRQLIRRQKLLHAGDDSVAILEKLKRLSSLSSARTVLLYSALPDEVQTESLMNELAAQGKTVLLPKVIDDSTMELRQYTGKKDLSPGAYNIMEPSGELFTDYAAIDVAIIPGMAFDSKGHRLGRGKGYYDRFLSQLTTRTIKIGLCFPWQLVDDVPTDKNDISMDCVIC
jgi:5-formyltetrahydrofolate cyclo-ligase